jgi:hypothetical protein
VKRIAITLLMAGLAVVSTATLATAQNSQLRTVRGTVTDKGDTPAASAVVYLKNARTLTVKTYIAEDQGEYHFSGLDPNADYEIHAERGDQMSASHTVSNLDSRKEFVVTLKLDRQKK